MIPQTSCPDPRRWRGLLEGTLPEPEQAELNAHLETCADCQQTLESLAAEGESWLAAVRGLGQVEESQAEPALRQALEELQGDFGRITTQAQTAGGEEIVLDFLAPSAKPGALGRLGHYDVLAVVGRGGMGVVLKAFDDVLQRVVAIKVMALPLAATASARKRFIREAQAAAAVRDEHIIDIHAVDEVNGLPYLVMEYVNGVSLQERLDQSGPLELKEILRIGMQTAAGLDKAHVQGLIHRDIKPANILLENGVQRVKITDFGLARAVDDASLTQSGVIAGTPEYMAPEQARGEPVDHRADLFSLGSVLYAMCTGRPPFRASSMMAVLKRVSEDMPRPVREINPDIPDWLCAIIDKLHAKEPAQRFQSAQEVADLLGQHLAHLQQPALAPMPPLVGLPYARPATAAQKPTLLGPVLLMLTPFLLIPVVMATSLLFGLPWLLLGLFVVISGVATLTGLIWFVWLTARQGQEKAAPPPPTVARPPRPQSRKPSHTLPWALAVACVVGLGCCVLGVPVLGMLAWFFVGYSKVQPEVQPKSEERVEPVWPDKAAPALEAPLAAARVRRFAPPKDVPLTQDGVTATADGWKIENTDFPKRTVRLFEVRDLDVKDCRLVFRVQMKTETKEKLENRRIFTRLETAFRPKVTIKKAPTGDTVTEKSWSALARSGNTGWAQEEAATNCRSQPEVIALNLLVEGIGVMWIKDVELVATPLAAPKVGGKSTAKPFVILPRAGGAERPCFNLVEAVAFAKNGDTIEVRGNGPFVSPPIVIQDRRLTIRAAAGFHPILELSPEGVEQNTFLIRATNAPLVLEGLECRYTGAKRWAEGVPGVAIVYSNGSPLHVANCRFFLNRREGHQFGLESIRMNHSLACECRNCLFLVGGGCSLGWWPSASATLTVDNCLFVGGYGASVGGWDAPDRWPSSIRLTHNTLRVHYSLAFWFSKDLSRVTRSASDKRLRVDAVGNVMGTVGLNLNQDSGEKPLPVAEIEALLRRLVAWKDENNLYPQNGKDLLELTFNHDQPIPQARPRKSLTDWNEFWELTGTGSRQGHLLYKDTDLWTTMTRTPDQVSPESFRLIPGSAGHGQGPKGRNLGADVDLVGPGPAYERWKKTPEYQRWLKNTGQVKE